MILRITYHQTKHDAHDFNSKWSDVRDEATLPLREGFIRIILLAVLLGPT